MLNKIQENKTNTDDRVVANNRKIVNVAVAVIHYQEQYLLGFRNSSQHQGERYEFVGGKIDGHETASVALIREVSEETGIDIQSNHLVKLGRLYHDYGDKQVCLQVYKVALTTEQYKQHQHCDYGLEGQALTWVTKSQLLAGDYPLPAANQTILAWLQLPTQITVTYPLAHFSEETDTSNAWLAYHQQHLSKNAWVYIRTKASELEGKVANLTKATDAELADQLMHLRPDIYSVLSYATGHQHNSTDEILAKPETLESTSSAEISNQVVAVHLTHHELICWFNDSQNINSQNSDFKYNNSKDQSKNSQHDSLSRPLIVSCHDADSIHAANQLAATRLQHQQPPVIGIFLSPILATQSHPDSEPLGWQAWSELANLADMPVIGLGGLSPKMFEQATQYGAISIAGIRQFLQG